MSVVFFLDVVRDYMRYAVRKISYIPSMGYPRFLLSTKDMYRIDRYDGEDAPFSVRKVAMNTIIVLFRFFRFFYGVPKTFI